jgi:molecular chaperone GrpE (heat shock protein)
MTQEKNTQKKTTSPKSPPSNPSPSALIKKLQQENQILEEKARLALADYQNLVRRQQQEQTKVIEYAKTTIFESLIQPLEHLTLAAKALNDQGLNIVIKQFWQTLANQGLVEFSPEKEKFDPETMEAVEKEGNGDTVITVLSPGYKLNHQVIKTARVKVG